ncbi:hypothetical protein MTR67_029053 [Solanum verrucosum]|uniref:U6 snRNA-associated Sm-like protein LSm8 n=1 Tax=Solanum verrucosum TaxID=315347 RepID=A0AAF0R6Q6_SOLVR|nr:hypothetical protein MTR67_029053 [Solanum verrucosum]
MATGLGLESLVDQTISVITNDGRNIVVRHCVAYVANTGLETLYFADFLILFQGVLRGFDQATNLILDESHERVYSTKFAVDVKQDALEGVQQLVLGLYIIRGDNISVVGELDEDLDSNLDMSKLRAHPLKPVVH